MSISKQLAILVASALVALLVFAPGDARVRAGAGEPPPNDDFADATVIGELPFSDGPVDLSGATVPGNEPRSTCGLGVDGSVWYAYSSAEDAVLIAESSSVGLRAIVAVWSDQGRGLAEVACGRPGGQNEHSRAAFPVIAGETYYVQVSANGVEAPATHVTFTLTEGIAPSNTIFEAAAVVSALPFSDIVNTEAALTEPAEPPACIGGKFGIAPASTVWYTFVPTEDALVVADTVGSDFDTVINVLTPSTFGLIPFACDSSLFSDPPRPARVALEVRAGDVYHFQVGGVPYTSPFGNLTFNLAAGVPPPNDDFASAIDIGQLPFDGVVETIDATVEAGEPAPSCAPRGVVSSVWYRVASTEEALILVDPTSSDYRPIIGVYQGDSLGALTQVLCGGATSPGLLGFRAAAGETYYLQFSSFTRKRTPVFVAGAPPDAELPSVGGGETASVGNGGNLEFHLESRAIPSCPSPTFSIEDRANDVNVWFAPPEAGRPHDIVSVGSSSTDDEFCIRVELAGPVDPPSAGTDHALVGTIVFDTDEDEHSGIGLDVCGSTRALGVDVEINVRGRLGLLEPIEHFIGEPGQTENVGQFAITLFDGNIFTLVVPLDAIGGDDSLRFALMVSDEIIGGSDCAPDRGFIQVPPPAFGDANCDGQVDSRDSVIILQFFARLLESLPCESVADANGNGTIGSIDAALILQLDAGLIDVLPGAR